MGVRHVHGGAFVAHVDDADALTGDMVPDRLDVAALETEDAVDAARLQEFRDPGGAGLRVRVEILNVGHVVSFVADASCCILSSRCWILPVAVRGMSLSRMKATERGRL